MKENSVSSSNPLAESGQPPLFFVLVGYDVSVHRSVDSFLDEDQSSSGFAEVCYC